MRYDIREKIFNDYDSYKALRKKRDVSMITHYSTPKLPFPTEEQEDLLEIIEHIWKLGDRYYKLAYEFYGDSSLWWVIAWFNKKPTEGHLQKGDIVEIPFPLESVLEYYDI